MLCFVTTDCAITPAMLDKAIHQVADKTFNMISVDGDTSTNDTFAILANGAAGNQEITAEGADYDIFVQALEAVCRKLSKLMAGDGEGATKLLVCKVDGAAAVSYTHLLTPMRLSTWIFITTVARLPSVITSTVGGDALGSQEYLFAVIVFVATAVISGAGVLVYRKITQHHQKRCV